MRTRCDGRSWRATRTLSACPSVSRFLRRRSTQASRPTRPPPATAPPPRARVPPPADQTARLSVSWCARWRARPPRPMRSYAPVRAAPRTSAHLRGLTAAGRRLAGCEPGRAGSASDDRGRRPGPAEMVLAHALARRFLRTSAETTDEQPMRSDDESLQLTKCRYLRGSAVTQ